MADIIVERTDRDRGVGTGIILGIVGMGLAVVLTLFFVFGGTSRFMGGSGQTNVNVPAQSQPAAPQINIPRQIDVNINQQPAPQAPIQAPAEQAPAGNR
jgi:hypothetical protein